MSSVTNQPRNDITGEETFPTAFPPDARLPIELEHYYRWAASVKSSEPLHENAQLGTKLLELWDEL